MPSMAPRKPAIHQVRIYWDDDYEQPMASPDKLIVDVDPEDPQPAVIIWLADGSIDSIDDIDFNTKCDNPSGQFSDPKGGGSDKVWVTVDFGTATGSFCYAITATQQGGGQATNDPMIRNQ